MNPYFIHINPLPHDIEDYASSSGALKFFKWYLSLKMAEGKPPTAEELGYANDRDDGGIAFKSTKGKCKQAEKNGDYIEDQ